jgi:hypothetical protein
MKLLKAALEDQRWELAAHYLVIGLIKANQKQGSSSKSKMPRGHEGKNGKEKRVLFPGPG